MAARTSKRSILKKIGDREQLSHLAIQKLVYNHLCYLTCSSCFYQKVAFQTSLPPIRSTGRRFLSLSRLARVLLDL